MIKYWIIRKVFQVSGKVIIKVLMVHSFIAKTLEMAQILTVLRTYLVASVQVLAEGNNARNVNNSAIGVKINMPVSN